MYNNNYYHASTHPEHPVRNVFHCIYCTIFSLAFSYLWLCTELDFLFSREGIIVSVLILLGALLGGFFSFKRSHKSYLAHKKKQKRRC